ncbi:hypothetical protein AAF712_015352 [Marasmius tenuissimus]|uniref:Uncharacterized protein n=1 Tax=Marasmius tenuissimus TaxID=585030 RepID=A0ABR2ZAM1_9AGAR
MSRKTGAARHARKQRQQKEKQCTDWRAEVNAGVQASTGDSDRELESDVLTELDKSDLPPLVDITEDDYPQVVTQSSPALHLTHDIATHWERSYYALRFNSFESANKYFRKDPDNPGILFNFKEARYLPYKEVPTFTPADLANLIIRKHILSHFLDGWARPPGVAEWALE